MLKAAPLRAARARQRGLSLVELMVGVAVGLFIVAGAAMLAAIQLSDTRRTIVETQVQQDLRATADLIARGVRRANYWAGSTGYVWTPVGAVSSNPNNALNVVANTEVDFPSVQLSMQAFRLTSVNGVGVLQMRDNAGNWQDLTDKGTINITAFTPTLNAVANTTMACPTMCPPGAGNPAPNTACWPTLQVRELRFTITGNSIADPNVVRTVYGSARLRNNVVVNNTGAVPLCPGS